MNPETINPNPATLTPVPAEETLASIFRPKYTIFQLQKRARRAMRKSVEFRNLLDWHKHKTSQYPEKKRQFVLAAATRALRECSCVLANVEAHLMLRNVPVPRLA